MEQNFDLEKEQDKFAGLLSKKFGKRDLVVEKKVQHEKELAEKMSKLMGVKSEKEK